MPMLPRLAIAMTVLLAFAPSEVARSDTAVPSPPDLDCSVGFEALHKWAAWLPGAKPENAAGREIFVVSDPDVWRVEIAFTEPGQPAHPAVVLRKFLKQVTGVWTAQSKVCGYGDNVQFAAFMADMKAEDSRLTNASRAEAEQKKKELSPLGGP
jgi:hypothetical protein